MLHDAPFLQQKMECIAPVSAPSPASRLKPDATFAMRPNSHVPASGKLPVSQFVAEASADGLEPSAGPAS